MKWEIDKNKLTKTFKLKSFEVIIDRLTSLAKVTETTHHHPDFKVENYNEIHFYLFTHDKNSITEKDYYLAEKIDEIFN
jgi:4a-hydroxytetrahydrobiopterin dehydratase